MIMPLRRTWFDPAGRDRRVAFVGVPKCGLTSTVARLQLDIDHDWMITGERDLPGYKYFSIVRNPLDRFISGWLEARRRGTTEHSAAALLESIAVRGFDQVDEHVWPQRYWLTVHPIGRNKLFEFGDWSAIDEYIGGDQVVWPHLNPSGPLTIRADVDEELHRSVFADDWQLFENTIAADVDSSMPA